jgi:fatty-acid desaturase
MYRKDRRRSVRCTCTATAPTASPFPPGFSTTRLSLVDRGFAYAIAHIRGGDDLGRAWYKAGKLESRTNAFNDFVDVAKGLIARGPNRGRAHLDLGRLGGRRAAWGAVLNSDPELWGAVVAHCAVRRRAGDRCSTPRCRSRPANGPNGATRSRTEAAFELIRSYSPLRQRPRAGLSAAARHRRAQRPARHLLGARQVGRPACASSRPTTTSCCLKTNMGAGTAASPGRFESLKETAEEFAFILWQMGGLPDIDDVRGDVGMKSYNAIGYGILALYALACWVLRPGGNEPVARPHDRQRLLLAFWFLAGVYLADVLHLGIAHRSLDFKPWFMKAVTLTNNLFGVYVDPTAWVCRHRLHHTHSDHPGDPNKLAEDGFWRTLWPVPVSLSVRRERREGRDLPHLAVPAHLELPVRGVLAGHELRPAVVAGRRLEVRAVMWLGLRVFALWVNMIQNYWTHTRTFGYRRYDDARDNAMNIGEFLPVTATFSACLQNNHHHYPTLARLGHAEGEYDFGLPDDPADERARAGPLDPARRRVPPDVALPAPGF